MTKPISIQTYTVREYCKTPDDTRRVIAELADIGYAAIEAGVPKDMTPASFRQFLDDLGIRMSSSWAQPTRDNVNQLVDQAKALGFDCYAGCFGPDQFATLDEAKKTADAWEAMAQLLQPHGLKLCYHNHWWEFDRDLGGRRGWDVLMERAPTLACEIDMYWASNFGDVNVPELIARYAPRTPLLHVKDGPLVKGEPHVALGQGKMNLAECIQAADASVLQYLIVELDECGTDMMQAVRDSHTWLTQNGLGHGRR
jgi:sugar phosphate isomerase/epimerase